MSKPLSLFADRFVAQLNVLHAALHGNLKTLRHPEAKTLQSRQVLMRCRRSCNAARAGAANMAGTGDVHNLVTLSTRKPT